MNKTASPDLTPLQVALLSALGGAGVFGSVRLLQDAMRTTKPRSGIDDSANELRIDLPQAGAPQGGAPAEVPGPMQTNLKVAFDIRSLLVPEGMEPAANMNANANPAAAMPPDTNTVEGAVARYSPVLMAIPGFLGAKYLYDQYQGGQMDKEVDDTKQKYLAALQAQSQKNASASDTPYLDGFCEAIKESMEKEASEQGFWRSLVGSMPLADEVGAAGLTVGGASALAVLGAMIKADKERQKAKQDKSFPERVVLNNAPPTPSGLTQLP